MSYENVINISVQISLHLRRVPPPVVMHCKNFWLQKNLWQPLTVKAPQTQRYLWEHLSTLTFDRVLKLWTSLDKA